MFYSFDFKLYKEQTKTFLQTSQNALDSANRTFDFRAANVTYGETIRPSDFLNGPFRQQLRTLEWAWCDQKMAHGLPDRNKSFLSAVSRYHVGVQTKWSRVAQTVERQAFLAHLADLTVAGGASKEIVYDMRKDLVGKGVLRDLVPNETSRGAPREGFTVLKIDKLLTKPAPFKLSEVFVKELSKDKSVTPLRQAVQFLVKVVDSIERFLSHAEDLRKGLDTYRDATTTFWFGPNNAEFQQAARSLRVAADSCKKHLVRLSSSCKYYQAQLDDCATRLGENLKQLKSLEVRRGNILSRLEGTQTIDEKRSLHRQFDRIVEDIHLNKRAQLGLEEEANSIINNVSSAIGLATDGILGATSEVERCTPIEDLYEQLDTKKFGNVFTASQLTEGARLRLEQDLHLTALVSETQQWKDSKILPSVNLGHTTIESSDYLQDLNELFFEWFTMQNVTKISKVGGAAGTGFDFFETFLDDQIYDFLKSMIHESLRPLIGPISKAEYEKHWKTPIDDIFGDHLRNKLVLDFVRLGLSGLAFAGGPGIGFLGSIAFNFAIQAGEDIADRQFWRDLPNQITGAIQKGWESYFAVKVS